MDVKFKMGTGDLPTKEAGSLIIKTDTGELFVDTQDNQRVSLGSIKMMPLDDETEILIKNVTGIPVKIADPNGPEDGIEYYMLAIEKETNN